MANWLKVVEEVLEQNDPSEPNLHITFEALINLACTRPAQLRVAGTSIYGADVRFADPYGATHWAARLVEQNGASADALFQVAVLMSEMSGDPHIALNFVDACLKDSLAKDDFSRLRELRAACVASLLRPQILSSIGGPARKVKLASCANAALAHIHACLLDDADLHAAVDHRKTPELRILLVIAWVPANVDYGAHLRQLCSYALSLILAGRGMGRFVRLRVVFTYDTATTGLIQNFQGYTDTAVAAIEGAFKNALGVHSDFVELIHLHPVQFDTLGAWVRKVHDVAIEFQSDIALRWFGFYGSDIVIPFLHQIMPVIGIQFNATNQVDCHADILLNQGPLSEQQKASDSRWREHRIPIEVLPKRLTRTRADFRLLDGHSYLVSVLSGGRLEAALRSLGDSGFTDICGILDEFPDTDWLLVGVQNETELRGLHVRFDALLDAGRIQSFPFVDDLRSLYEHCYAMLHLPNMQGGGMGVAMAVEEGLPICAYAGTDPENFLHPDFIMNNWQGFVALTREVLGSVDHSVFVSREQKKWMVENNGLQAVGEDLFKHVQAAIAQRSPVVIESSQHSMQHEEPCINRSAKDNEAASSMNVANKIALLDAAVCKMNEEIRPRVFRRYQRDFFKYGFACIQVQPSVELRFERSVEIKRNEVWYGARSNADADVEFWLLTGTIAEGYPIICVIEVILSAHVRSNVLWQSARYKSARDSQIEDKLARFLAWRSKSNVDWTRLLSPRLVYGHVNFAHQAWNELPSLLGLLKKRGKTEVHDLEIVLQNAPLGSLRDMLSADFAFKETSAISINPADGGQRLDYRVSGNLFTDEAKEVVVAHARRERDSLWGPEITHCEGNLRLWLNYRLGNRTAVNQTDFLVCLANEIVVTFPYSQIAFFGFAFPCDPRFAPNTFSERAKKCREYEHKLLSLLSTEARARVVDFGRLDVLGAIRSALDIDYYVSGPGTAQHIPGWFASKPGHLIEPRNGSRIKDWYQHLNQTSFPCNLLHDSLYKVVDDRDVLDRNALYEITDVMQAVDDIISQISPVRNESSKKLIAAISASDLSARRNSSAFARGDFRQ